jgi:putative alpha-1,2-mannosidase
MQAAYLFNYSGQPWKTQNWAREIMDKYYGDNPLDGWPGDEDQGQMGAWFVMSAIGLFQMDGGGSVKPFYEIGSPLFCKITIHLDKRYYPGKTFVIEAKDCSATNRYIQSAALDGKSLSKCWFYHSDLIDGGSLVLEMGPKPNRSWATTPGDAPPSMSGLSE